MIDNSDVNAMLHEAINAGQPTDIFDEYKDLLERYLGKDQFPYLTVQVRTPFTCIGARAVKYQFSPSMGITEMFVRKYIRNALGSAYKPHLSSGTIRVLTEDLEHFLNREWPFKLNPDNLDGLAKVIYSFCICSRLMDRIISDTKKSPENIKISFFKTMVGIMTRFMRLFTK